MRCRCAWTTRVGTSIRYSGAVPSRIAFFFLTTLAFAQTHTMWRDYSGASDSAQYSALKQIDKSNVARLEVAWTYPTGDKNKYLFNPLVVDGTMYVLAKNNSIVALDAATGREIWVYTP